MLGLHLCKDVLLPRQSNRQGMQSISGSLWRLGPWIDINGWAFRPGSISDGVYGSYGTERLDMFETSAFWLIPALIDL